MQQAQGCGAKSKKNGPRARAGNPNPDLNPNPNPDLNPNLNPGLNPNPNPDLTPNLNPNRAHKS